VTPSKTYRVAGLAGHGLVLRGTRDERGVQTTAQRSLLMSKVRHSGTSTEIAVRDIFDDAGISYVIGDRSLPGSPDLSNREEEWAIYVNGCFWHFHRGCTRGRIPKTNRDYWSRKLGENRRRDARNLRQLGALGLEPIVVWGCELDDRVRLKARLLRALGRQVTREGTP
jgi:DNA mismatch endonuclease, patch repair protein